MYCQATPDNYIYIYIVLLTKINKHKQSVAKTNVAMHLDNESMLLEVLKWLNLSCLNSSNFLRQSVI